MEKRLELYWVQSWDATKATHWDNLKALLTVAEWADLTVEWMADRRGPTMAAPRVEMLAAVKACQWDERWVVQRVYSMADEWGALLAATMAAQWVVQKALHWAGMKADLRGDLQVAQTAVSKVDRTDVSWAGKWV